MKNQKGFTLLELVVTLSIIGILTTMAVPNYKSFKAKTRQKAGLLLLDSYFLVAQATRLEFGVYPGDLVQTGFQPTGLLEYRLHSENGTSINLGAGLDDDLCESTDALCDCGGACPNYKTWNEAPTGVVGLAIGPAASCSQGSCSGTTYTTDNQFRVNISGIINTQAATLDCHAIDHNKIIETCFDGVH